MKKISVFISILLLLILAACSNMIDDLKKAEALSIQAEQDVPEEEAPEEPEEEIPPITYKVVHHFEPVDVEPEVIEKQIIEAIPGTVTEAVAFDKSGFTSEEFNQKTVKEDSSTEVHIYYKRKEIGLAFFPNGGVIDLSSQPYILYGRYGESVPNIQNPTRVVIDPVRLEWYFQGWALDDEELNPENKVLKLPETFPAENQVYKALWSTENSYFKIKYKYQTAAGGDNYDVSEEINGAAIGVQTAVTADAVAGYLTPVIEQTTVLAPEADGFPSIATVTYNRKTIKITLDVNEGSWNSGEAPANPLTGLYGASVPSVENPVRDSGWGFVGWNEEGGRLPVIFPSEDVTYSAVWAKPYASYKVRHWFEKVDSTDENNFANYTVDASREETLNGGVGHYTAASALNVPGFEAFEITQKVLSENDDTVVDVYYKRKSVRIILNAGIGKFNDGDIEKVLGPAKYGTAVGFNNEIPSAVRSEFKGWNEDDGVVPETYPEADFFLTAKWVQTGALYKIEYYFEDKEGVYVEDKDKSVTEAGTVGEMTNVSGSFIEGFSSAVVTQAEIAADHSAVVKVEYPRKTINYTYNPNGGIWGGTWTDKTNTKVTVSGRYETNAEKPQSLSRIGYKFCGWTVRDVPTEIPSDGDFTFGSTDKEYVAVWKAGEVNYKLKYVFEKLDGTGYEENSELQEAESLKIKSNEPLSVSPKSFTGYNYVSVEYANVDIADGNNLARFDDSTVVTLKYDRNIIVYTYDPDGGVWTDNSSSTTYTVEGKYESVVQAPKDVSRPDYEYQGWDPEIPENFGIENKTFKAKWKLVGSTYTVNYYFEKLSTPGEYDLGTGTFAPKKEIGSALNPFTYVAPEFAGFKKVEDDHVSFENLEIKGGQNYIKADGSTVVNVYYDRKTITYTFDANRGKFSDNKLMLTIEGRYGSAVSTVSNPSLTYNIFAGWDKTVPETFGASDETFTAVWTQIPLTTISGAGTYTNGDITLTVLSQDSSPAKLKVVIPYNGDWLIDLYDNGNQRDDAQKNVVTDGVEITVSLTKGRHKLDVLAKENGIAGTEKTKFVTVVIN